METNLVAVYGSLRKGLHNHRVLGNSEFKGEGILKGFGMYSLGAYPALSNQHAEEVDVVVEVYQVDPDTMDNLDHLEGYPLYYSRKLCRIHKPSGDVVAWVYYIKDSLFEHDFVASGDWAKYLEGNND